MIEKVPRVLILGTIAPKPESARREVLRYDKLEETVYRHAPYESRRSRMFWDALEGSLAEQDAALQLATQYMLMGSLALNKASTPELRQLWSDRYTQATAELYGLPDAETARELLEARENGLELSYSFETAALQIGAYLDWQYDDVYRSLGLDSAPERIPPTDLADRFETALETLQANHDDAWSEWVVERNEEKDSLCVIEDTKKIVVGMKRACVTPTQLRALFSHEVLVHALRAVNGEKRSSQLKAGLPGYIEAEEGLGVFVEYAVTGEISEKIIDRYVDIAYALGQIDGETHTRAELLTLTMERALQRNERAEHKKSLDDLEREVYAHVNRIYRGSRGDEHVGIFTKDIVYHQGFIGIGQYISEELAAGTPVYAVMAHLMSGKFDPRNDAHVRFLQEYSHGARQAA